jgi:hypothetical protein
MSRFSKVYKRAEKRLFQTKMSSSEASANPLYWEVVLIAPESGLARKAFRGVKGYYVAEGQHFKPFKP